MTPFQATKILFSVFCCFKSQSSVKHVGYAFWDHRLLIAKAFLVYILTPHKKRHLLAFPQNKLVGQSLFKGLIRREVLKNGELYQDLKTGRSLNGNLNSIKNSSAK